MSNEICAKCGQHINQKNRTMTIADGMAFHRHPCFHEYDVEQMRRKAWDRRNLEHETEYPEDENLGDDAGVLF